MRLIEVWAYLNSIKVLATTTLDESQWRDVKEACDDLFRQASDNKYSICPAWWIAL